MRLLRFLVFIISLKYTFGNLNRIVVDEITPLKFLKENFGGNIDTRKFNDTCTLQLTKYFTSLGEQWAQKMFDASSKIPSGLLSGNLVDLGNFDQCIGIETKTNYDNSGTNKTILGKYCFLNIPLSLLMKILGPANKIEQFTPKFQPPNLYMSDGEQTRIINLLSPMPFISLSICIPDGCTEAYFANLISKYPDMAGINVGSCQTKEANSEISAGAWGFIAFLIIIGVIMFLSTIYDYLLHNCECNEADNEKDDEKKPRKPKAPIHPICTAFSVYTNGRKLFAVSKNPAQLECVNGIRFWSMVWVVFGHSYYAFMFSPTVNTAHLMEWMKLLMTSTLTGATVSVDSFFMLGGLVMVYVYMKSVEKGLKFNILLYYLHRYIRLTPSLAVVMVAHITILPYLGAGPYWNLIITSLSDFCSKWWWTTLLYVQNYVNGSEMCLGQTWYLSVDMQLFILSPIILLPLGKWPKATLISLYVYLCLGIISPFVISWEYGLSGSFATQSTNPRYMTDYYFNTYARFGAWIVGCIVGYYIYTKDKNVTFNRMLKNTWINLTFWAMSIAVLLAVIYGSNNLMHHPYDKAESAIFLGFHRVAWSIALGFIAYACVTGRGGPINSFLSLPIFQILARLTYSMYLIHLSIQFLRVGSLRSPRYFDDYNVINEFWGNFGITLTISVLLTLAFESPMIAIEKIIFRGH